MTQRFATGSRFIALVLLAIALAGCQHDTGRVNQAAPTPYTIFRAAPEFVVPPIVVQFDPVAQTGVDWSKAVGLAPDSSDPAAKLHNAVLYLQEGIARMTGKTLEVICTNDLSKGIVITTLAGASEDIKNDPEVKQALRDSGKDAYNHREAFFLRSEAQRLLIVANRSDGLVAAIPALLESVGYEVLGMGPNWTYVPHDHQQELTFAIRQTERPSYYLRVLTPTSGQTYGVGTIYHVPLSDPADEPVDVSMYRRWEVGARMAGQSMSYFPGHTLQTFHQRVGDSIKASGNTEGFLCPTKLGPDTQRPAAAKENAGTLWINSDAKGTPAADKVFLSDGSKWNEAPLGQFGINLDLSVPAVRTVVLDILKQTSEDFFKQNPNEVCVFGHEPEDGGGYNELGKWLKNKNWYPDYLASEGVAFGKPYALHGFKGIDHPKESWDPDSASDTVYGFSNWLLREYDKWIDSRPPAERVTATGKSKKAQIRTSLYSYNYHDVPPDFNLDPRLRVMIASYPKHRGTGKWKMLVSQLDMAKAYQVMLPREPSGDYRIISLAWALDPQLEGIPLGWSASPASIVEDLAGTYKAGIKALNFETDFNFGKFGLAYYLMTKMLWNANLSATELDAIRDRWFQRAYGSVWPQMKTYYDFMLHGNYPVNGPNTWAHAIRLIEAADKKLDPIKEPEAKRRIDDLKVFWLYYYLIDMGKAKRDDPDFRAFAWKSQMSYMIATHVLRQNFGVNSPVEMAGDVAKGPAHYTLQETAAWWAKLLEHWPETTVARFADATLANGQPAKAVDLNDLVAVKEFAQVSVAAPFLYNATQKQVAFYALARSAGEEIGFKIFWPDHGDPNDHWYYGQRDVVYGIETWDPKLTKWEMLVDKTTVNQPSRKASGPKGEPLQLVEVRFKAPRPGTYKMDLGYACLWSQLAPLTYDIVTGKLSGEVGMTYYGNLEAITQSAVYIYIPKGTKSLDLEIYDNPGYRSVVIGNSLMGAPSAVGRKVAVDTRGTHRISLQPGEDGTVAVIEGNGFAFPYLYSIPTLWAKSPAELLVPRAIAQADGLTIE